MSNISSKAKKAINIIIAASNSSEPSQYFGRKFDDIFENGNSGEIVNEIVKNYLNDELIQKAIAKVDRWIGIDGWLNSYYKTNAKSLF
ncbi:hypothetical protein ACOL3H_11930 [Aliarcobacter butzleri]